MEPYFQGWLFKSPHDGDVIHPFFKFLVGKWRKRFFVLFGPPTSYVLLDRPKVVLEYFEGHNLKKKRGSIDLSTCDQIMTHYKFGNFKHVISFVANHRTGAKRCFHLAAEDQTSMDGWVDAINSLLGLPRGYLHLHNKHTVCLSAPSIPEISTKADSTGKDGAELLTCFGRQGASEDFKDDNESFVLTTNNNNNNYEASSFDHGCYDDLSFQTSAIDNSQVGMFRPSPSLPSIYPRRSKISELDVEVPLFKLDQRDSGFSGDMGDIHDDHHYYKAPKHNYNNDTSMTPVRRMPFQPQAFGSKSWYAVPPKRPEVLIKCLCRSTKAIVTSELPNVNRNPDLDVKIPVASTNSDCDSINRHPITDKRIVYDVPKPGMNKVLKNSSDEFDENPGTGLAGNFVKAHQVAWNLERKTLTSACCQIEGLNFHHDSREGSLDDDNNNNNNSNNNKKELKCFFIERQKICDKKPFSDRTLVTIINNNKTTSDDITIGLDNNNNKSQHRQQPFLHSQTYLKNLGQLLRQHNNDDDNNNNNNNSNNNNKESIDNSPTNLEKSSTFSSSKDLERRCGRRGEVQFATSKRKTE